ncbi:MAG TPA: hypothetical protein VFB45_06960 [Pseudolabrys sp.]|nr:hypothetical protein [Pseudolabrys sp.]
MRGVLLAGALAGVCLTAAGHAKAAGFDGAWSVLVVTDKGDCDRGYRYAVSVAEGHVSYADAPGINLAGTVSSEGHVRVTISKGSQRAVGTGKLSAHAGAGSWSGQGASGTCSGHWEAERR